MIEPGSTLGHYAIVSALGKGGMGEVWRARDTRLDREVAIKTLPSELAGNEERLARFEREARVLASLNHANVATIYGIEEADGTRFLVLELVEGNTLEDRLKTGPIPLDEALQLATQLVDALEAAHEKDVVHRDLKPANIKITPAGLVKVLDFGLAKALAGGEGILSSETSTLSLGATQQGAIVGTPSYMSPEQARGERTDARTDVWAFGCVLYEMIAGHQTFGGATLSDALASVIARDPDWKLVPANLHPRIRLLIERCLEKDLNKRYHHIADARADIEVALADPKGLFAGKEHAPASARVSGWVPWVVAGAAVAGLLFLLGGVLESDTDVAVVRMVASVYPSPPVNAGNGNVPLVAISPNGTQVAYPAVIDEQLTIYLRDVANLAGQRLRPEGLMAAPFYSPDGSEIGFMNPSDTTMKRASVDGSDIPETLYAFDTNFPFGATWDDEDHIVFGLINDGRGLLRIPDRGGPGEEITQLGPGEEHVYPDVLPEGRGILFTTILNEGGAPSVSIDVLNLSTNERRSLIESGAQPRYLDAGIIVYNDEGTLRAVRFDVDALEINGSPITVLEGVEYYAGSFGAQFDVSRNGSLVYMNRTSLAGATERRLAIVDALGQREPLATQVAPYMHPRVSPDGTEIAVQTLDANNQGIIWIYNFERAALRQLSRSGSNVRPIWTPDGERITFASNRDGNWGLYWQRADGSDIATRLTTADEGREHYPDSWSPDGRWITFTDIVPNQGAMQSVRTLDVTAEGTEPVQLTEPVSGGLEFSVDGDWIAYRLNNQVVVEPFPQTGAVYQVTQAGGSYPVWSPDGTRLLYRRAVGTQGSSTSPLVTVDVNTEGVFTFGNERIPPITGFLTFFGHRDYDFMPDGERLVMVFPSVLDEVSSEEFVPRINVVLNWVEELKERLSLD